MNYPLIYEEVIFFLFLKWKYSLLSINLFLHYSNFHTKQGAVIRTENVSAFHPSPQFMQNSKMMCLVQSKTPFTTSPFPPPPLGETQYPHLKQIAVVSNSSATSIHN